MKHIMIRIAGGMVAAFGIIVNRGHADVNNCTTWTNETAGNLNYKKCSYNSDGGGYRYFASWSSVPTGSNALAPARETCMNAMGTIDYPGCKSGRCNQTGIVCEDTGLLFSVGCCLASPSYGQPGACATNATGCRVQVMPIEAANYTYYLTVVRTVITPRRIWAGHAPERIHRWNQLPPVARNVRDTKTSTANGSRSTGRRDQHPAYLSIRPPHRAWGLQHVWRQCPWGPSPPKTTVARTI